VVRAAPILMPTLPSPSLVRLALTALTAGLVGLGAPGAGAATYAPGRIVVGFAPGAAATAQAASMSTAGVSGSGSVGGVRVLSVAPGASVPAVARRLSHRPGIAYAVPDYVAHASGFIPNDPGYGAAGDWRSLQWNFAGTWGVNAPDAWAHLNALGASGGHGVTVAVLDTGVAYANHGHFRRSPDFTASQFVAGYDFVGHNTWPEDHLGHGTHVASTIAEATNNGIGVTGLAYGARIMPVRVLDSSGSGSASDIAAGIRFATNHGAQVINLSLEFSADLGPSDVPELISAINYAHRRGVVIVAASGNEGDTAIPYPAHARYVISVGATTEHGCLSDFSNYGRGLSLVAPGGGADAQISGDANCHPFEAAGRDIYQVTFTGQNPRVFGVTDNGYEGTSMATPHVSATAALVIASGLLGRRPSPDAVYNRIRLTTKDLGYPGYDNRYGFGLIDAAAATDPANPAGLPAVR
jgi:serine protease